MIPKQDRTPVRTPAHIEQKYNLDQNIDEVLKVATNANRTASTALSTANKAAVAAAEAKSTADGFGADISVLKSLVEQHATSLADIISRLEVLEGYHNTGLPAGYTLLEYIQSSGTQYIDTGFMPNQDTQVIIDAEILSSNPTGDRYISAVRVDAGYWTLRMRSDLSGYAARYPGASLQNVPHSGDVFARHTFNQNKNVVQIDDASAVTFTAATWSSTRTLPIFCYRSSDTAHSGYVHAKLYSCQIYDNGTLIRDYVPCKNASGEFGLYDKVNSQFYGNSGSGAFTGA